MLGNKNQTLKSNVNVKNNLKLEIQATVHLKTKSRLPHLLNLNLRMSQTLMIKKMIVKKSQVEDKVKKLLQINHLRIVRKRKERNKERLIDKKSNSCNCRRVKIERKSARSDVNPKQEETRNLQVN